ncbi:PTS system mannose/fructose/N-acetylgalactosamine-transporter subunit IIB [Paratractidigestivibacter faecalis]|uniref:PTS system mannose/fructose/N-acetylgalactosamine-transporter subunit IIB n=1 Tax=Paratractidigestivibacter faecalis TaxID=2292441 RepID=UPI003A928DFE
MIIQIRVDDRLIHGQVAILWSKELNSKGILAANDRAASNPIISATLKMACPSSQKLLIKSVDDAIRIAKDPRGGSMRIFALVDCVADALKIVEACPEAVGEVNVANVGRFDNSDPAQQVNLIKSVMLNPDELEACRKLVATGVTVIHQVTPSDRKVSVEDLLKTL